MPNIASVLKAEIARIARKETRAAVARLHGAAGKARKDSAAAKQRIGQLESQVKALAVQLGKLQKGATAEPAAADLQITGSRVKSLRGRLGVTQAEFGLLVGVSAQAVAHWERQRGKVKLRSKAKAGLAAARGLRARDARARLEELAATKTRRKPARRG